MISIILLLVALAVYPNNNPVHVWHSPAKAAHVSGVLFRSNIMGCIYQVRNKVNGKCYRGRTVKTMTARKAEHICNAKYDNNCVFHRAIRKYGMDAFEWEEVYSDVFERDLNGLEIECIKWFGSKIPNGYNMTDGGEGSIGYKHSEEVKKKIGDISRGRKHTEEAKKKISEKTKGKTRSEETKRKISVGQMGKTYSEKTKRKMRMSHLGKTLGAKSRLKISIFNKGKIVSPETGAKISDAKKRHWKDPEYRNKTQATLKKQRQSPEYRTRQSEIIKELWKNPEYKAKMQKAQNSEKTRIKRSKSLLRAWAKRKSKLQEDEK